LKYLVIIPALNEEDTIGHVIEGVKQSLSFADIVVVNDGSKDNTAQIAQDKGAIVLNHPYNLGYGAALQTGFRFAVDGGYDRVITIDADGQHIASYALNLIDAMNKNQTDVVIGSRFINGGYKVGLIKKIGIWLFSRIGRTHTGITITDPTSGFQLLNSKAFSYLAKSDDYPLDYPDVNIIILLHKRQFNIIESPVEMREKSGKSMHSGLKPVIYIIRMFLSILMVLIRKKGD
jgi:glycosyltransferase involved in cell wall biosynthesis